MYNHTGNLLLKTALLLAVNNQHDDPSAASKTSLSTNSDPTAVCYGELGCYSTNAPWIADSRPVANHPEAPEKVDPVFCLYTRKNPRECQRLKYEKPETITGSHMVASHRTYIISHGFLENGYKKWIQVMTHRLLAVSDCNVIVVGWEGGSSPPYTQAVANIRLIGTMGAFLVNALHKHLGVRTEWVHAIGHSLGAHLSGYIGNVLKTRFNLTLGRISALDPAEPHFSQTDPVVRLDTSDAMFVDVVHTDAMPFIQGGLGMDEPVGHLDFYPNGGNNQPGCGHGVKEYIKKEEGSFVKGMRRFLGCDHVRSYEYFIESIYDRCAFLAVECDNYENFLAGKCFGCKSELNPDGKQCSKLGFHSVRTAVEAGAEVGQFHPNPDRSLVKLYTITNSQQPFCKSLYRVTVRMSSSKESKEHGGEVGSFRIQIVGTSGQTEFIDLYKEQPFKPGSFHSQVIGGTQVGRVRTVNLIWTHQTTLNILSWRFGIPTVHLESVTVDSLEESSSLQLCPVESQILSSGKETALRPCEGAKTEELFS
uniref:Pancreatic lipase-related protein 2 n=2 Tax=Lygus hesperus TaxID=30085 RepID=A0A0A9XYG4_LYGHE